MKTFVLSAMSTLVYITSAYGAPPPTEPVPGLSQIHDGPPFDVETTTTGPVHLLNTTTMDINCTLSNGVGSGQDISIKAGQEYLAGHGFPLHSSNVDLQQEAAAFIATLTIKCAGVSSGETFDGFQYGMLYAIVSGGRSLELVTVQLDTLIQTQAAA